MIVLEDNPEVAESLSVILGQIGIRSQNSSSLTELRAAAQGHKNDMVVLLLDSRLLRPDTSHRTELAALDLLAPTMLMDQDAANRPARDLGVIAVVAQSVNSGHLLRAVRHCLGVARNRADPSLAGAW